MTDKTFVVPEAINKNQKRGRGYKKKKTQRSYSSPYQVTAKSFDEPLSLSDVKSLYNFLNKQSRKINKYNLDVDGLPTEDYLDYLDAGASAGLAWTRQILKSEGILKTYSQDISDEEINKEEQDNWSNVSIQKAANDELMQVTFVAMVEGVDAHSDFVDEEEIRKAKESFNKSAQRCKMFHMWDTNGAEVIESYQSPVDFILNDRFISKGTWLMSFQVYDERLWKMIKDGEINGISIGAMAQCITVEEEE